MSRLVSIVAVSLIAAGTSSLARAQVATTTAARAVRSGVTKAALAKAKEQALTVIQGNAISASNGQMNSALIRLRDARFGRIVDTQLTDQSPFRIPPFAGLMGSTSTPSAAAVATEAAASSVISMVPTTPISPNQ